MPMMAMLPVGSDAGRSVMSFEPRMHAFVSTSHGLALLFCPLVEICDLERGVAPVGKEARERTDGGMPEQVDDRDRYAQQRFQPALQADDQQRVSTEIEEVVEDPDGLEPE